MTKINKVIFLDIDGVLTSVRTGWYNFDIYTIHFLRWLCKKTGAKIVISSTWRYNHNYKFWKPIFDEFLHDDYKTPNFMDAEFAGMKETRGCEIQTWLNKHPEIEQYLILDDDSDMLESQIPSFIKTDQLEGLLFSHMEAIRNYFGIEEFPNFETKLHQHKNMFATGNLKRYLKKRWHVRIFTFFKKFFSQTK